MRTAPRPGIAALLERARVGAGGPWTRDRRVRAGARDQRRRAGGGGARGRPPAAGRHAGGGCGPRHHPRGREPDTPGPDEDGGRRGAHGAGRPGSPARRRARSCCRGQARDDRRHHHDRRAGWPRRCCSRARGPWGSSASSPGASRTRRGSRPSSGRRSATSSARRAVATGASTRAHALDACDDLFIRHGGHAAAAGFGLPAERWGRVRGAVPRDRGLGRRRTRARRWPWTWRCRPNT